MKKVKIVFFFFFFLILIYTHSHLFSKYTKKRTLMKILKIVFFKFCCIYIFLFLCITTHKRFGLGCKLLLLLLLLLQVFKANCSLMGPVPKLGVPSTGFFLRDPSKYLREFRRKRRKIPNGQVDKRARGLNLSPPVHQF